jgi:hypothetical protein
MPLRVLLCCVVMALFSITTAGQPLKADAPTRIALAGRENGGNQQVLDAAMVVLSKDTDLQLLDRAEVGRVLREQEISLAGLVRAEQAVKVGQLLHVDMFAVLDGTTTNYTESSLGLVVFDAKTVVRYADSALLASNAVSAASATADAIRVAVAKSRRRPQDLHTVGVLLVRNADLPRQLDGLCDSVGLLLERELTKSPGIAVLERRRLEQVSKERSLVPETNANSLLASLRMVELDVSQYGTGLRGTLALVGTGGYRTNGISVSVSTRDPAALANLLSDRIAQLLNAPSDAASANRAAEAARFHREYQLLLNARDYAAAVLALDAAIALAPEQGDWLREMALLLPYTAIEMIDPGNQNHQGVRPNYFQPAAESLASSLIFGQRGADLLMELSRDAVARARLGEPVPEVLAGDYRHRLCQLLKKLAGVKSGDAVRAAEIVSLADKERILRMEVFEPFLRSRLPDAASWTNYSQQVNSWLYPGDRVTLNERAEQRWQDDVLLLSHWIDAAHKLNPPDASGLYWPVENKFFFIQYPGVRLAEFTRTLEQDPDPVIRLYGRLGRVASSMSRQYPTDAMLAAEREFRHYAQDLLTHGDATKPGPFRNHVWAAINTALGLVVNHPDGWHENLEACRFAFEHQDIQPQLFRSTAASLNRSRNPKPIEQLEVVNRALKLVRERPDAFLKPKYGQIERTTFIKEFEQIRDHLVAELAGTNNAPLTSPWKQGACLFDLSKSSNGFAWLFKPVILGREVFAVTLGIQEWGAAEDSLQLVRAPLSGGPAAVLGRAGITGINWGPNGSGGLQRGPQKRFEKGYVTDWDWPDVTRAACTGAGYYFAATCAGVYFFPTNGGPVFRLCATNGLPSDDVHAVAFLGGKLYIATGEHRRAGYFVSYDMINRKVSVLASSRRSERISPFDDGPPFHVHSLLGEPNRHQLLLTVSSFNVPNGKPRQMNSSMGIWTYSPAGAEFKRVAPLSYFTSHFPKGMRTENWAGLVNPTTSMVIGPNILFDLQKEKIQPVFESSSPPMTAVGNLWLNPVDRQTGTARHITGPYLVCDGWLYSAMPFERRALTDARREKFSSPRAEYEFEPKEALQLLDDGKQVLAADQYSIWLLELNHETAGKTSTKTADHATATK